VILIDAGPLVAILHRDDRNHERCVEALRSLRDRVGTTWAVLSEAMHLLRFSWEAQDGLWDLILTAALHLIPIDTTDVPRMRQLMQKYKDLPMDLADATLVRVAEREGIGRVFTIDRRDFALYRPAKMGRFQIIP
jgi:predicted nucleic acid-binding protein